MIHDDHDNDCPFRHQKKQVNAVATRLDEGSHEATTMEVVSGTHRT